MSGRDRERLRIGTVIVAAGRSQRMGRPKALLDWGGRTSIERILAALEAGGAGAAEAPVRVVLRPELARHPGAGEAAERSGAEVVVNPDPDAEMLDSIRLGVAALPFSLEAFLVWPVDHPLVAPESVRTLAAMADGGLVRIPTFRGRRGHPALVGGELRAPLAALPPGAGLRDLWRIRPDSVSEVPLEDPGIVANVDTPEDYDAALRTLRPR